MSEVAEGGNVLYPYCGLRWLYSTCLSCERWTCGDVDCRSAHWEAKHESLVLAELMKRSGE